jgi:HEAT repeat protein
MGAVLGVLLAGRDRQHAPSALVSVQDALFDGIPPAELIERLLSEGNREVRRWAFAQGRDRDLFTPERLLSLVKSDPDQWLRATAAGDLLPVADPVQLRVLLTTNTVEARLVALTRLPDERLSNDDLLPLLGDRAPRIREQASWRTRRRGIDVVAWYRARIAVPGRSARARAAVLDGLAAVGGPGDLAVFRMSLNDGSPRVRAAALTGLRTHASREEAVSALTPVLLDPSPRVSSASARALARLTVPPAVAETAWESPQPWSRRAAWRINRAAGGWDRVEADLRAAADPDPLLASLGLAGVRNWLQTSAATLWIRPDDGQRERIQELLGGSHLAGDMHRNVAFHAGIELPPR